MPPGTELGLDNFSIDSYTIKPTVPKMRMELSRLTKIVDFFQP